MKLIVGLGNKGIEYENNRHNIGFKILDKYLEKKNIMGFKEKFNALIIKEGNNIFAKPLTYMNLSGNSIIQILNFYKIDPKKDLIIIYDEMDLKVGDFKLKESSNSTSHNGIKSINENIGKEFLRLKIGIDRPKNKNIIGHVLGNFLKEEWEILEDKYNKIFNLLDDFLNNKEENNINLIAKYNQKEKTKKEEKFKIRLSKKSDIENLLKLKDSAIEYQKEQNTLQWSKDYPNENDFLLDIEKKQGYIYEKGNKIFAYCALCYGIDEMYLEFFDGNIEHEKPYSVIHRVMVDKNEMNQGIASEFLEKIIKISYKNSRFITRIDTHENNIGMNKVIEKLNFKYIAKVFAPDRSERKVFQIEFGG